MPSALFEFFEVVADELATEPSRVITSEEVRVRNQESPLLESLQREMKTGTTDDAIDRAAEALQTHFQGKSASPPFDYDPTTARFTARDVDYLTFINDMRGIRSIGKRSRDFECNVANWLSKRATGSIHRVGHPRDVRKNKAPFNEYLGTLGFDRSVLFGREKDGGLDILWLLPVGTIPHRPIVSIQCKNGEFKLEVADISTGAASRSLGQNSRLQPSIHVPCVLFNDYVHPGTMTQKQMNFVPLGLSDLAPMQQPITVELI